MSNLNKLVVALGAASAVGMIFFAVGVLRNDSLAYWYLPYNLALGLVPLLLAIWLQRLLKKYDWKNWRTLLLLAIWLLFLPNSFYIVTDFIHFIEQWRVDMLQDVVMLMQFSVLGFTFGMMSVYILHKAYLTQLTSRIVAIAVIAVLFLSSFAIYLGRELRWNSWDVFINPVGVVSDAMAIINPLLHPAAAWMTASFFMMLVTLYSVWWYGVRGARK